MFGWIQAEAQSSASKLQERSLLAYCNDMSISITDICQNSQTLNINISNTNVKRVDAIIVRLTDIYDNIEVKETNVTIIAFDDIQIDLIKQGTLRQVEIIPAYDDEKRYICQNNIMKKVGIKQC